MTPAIAAVGSAMLIAISACGQTAERPAESLGAVQLSAAESLQQSVENTQEVNSYTAQIALDFTDPKQGAGTVKGTMVYHQKPQVASDITLDQISAGGQNVPGGVRVILLGKTAYVKVEMLSKLIGNGKPWIKLDLAQMGQKAGVSVDQFLAQAQQVDLQSSVKMLTTSKDVKSVGSETVGGVETTHYKGTFAVADAVKQLTPEMQQKLQGQLANVKDMNFNAWIDAQGLPRKVEMDGAAAEGTYKLTTQFTSFNDAAEVTAPAADQVGELPANLGNMDGTGSGTGTSGTTGG
ncbi:LppX_LprAFG lipoprotein [Sphaerisporangium sp. TRM90804]|uniref:LppX_LprAFG lipoprotein n=1 Tax=Sphaerisporangium sp. TRM90804 TaxID=3031113 RepID=UPI00244806B8|nr:LppX_LprAFG lipoprotein [Sphaerisporangium sp. TRM90804]MDH2427087.1 LppX_LprAFG lipoprotein [Sphaerisporangium sp. TRM90804]